MKLRFADCVLDDQSFTLTRDGIVQTVEPQVLDLLAFLARNPGVLIDRDRLIEEVWAGRIVSDSAISARISAARKAVGDDGKRQAVIRTVQRRGFQFVAQVSSAENGPDPTVGVAADTASPVIRFATSDDGVKIAYATSGSGPPMLRVAHHPTHIELDWDEPIERALFDEFGRSNTLIRMDQRGCGLSDLDVDDFSTARSAKDMLAVVDTLNLDRFVLFGSSSGALIAVNFAACYPERVSHLVLVGGYVEGRSIRDGATVTKDGDAILQMAQAGWNTPGSAFVSGYLAVYFPTASQEQLRLIGENLQKSCPVENEIAGRTFFNNHSISELLAHVQAPTLVLHSRDDAVHPLSEGQKLAKGIPNAQLVVLESRNHNPLPDEPCWAVMHGAIAQFLKDT